MKHRDPASIGLSLGPGMPPLGRASLWELGAGRDGEVWRLPAGEEATGDRLLSLGAAGIGGFIEGGADAEGVWLLRRHASPTLSDRMKERRGPWPWREATRAALEIARALAACEKKSLFPGPLTPETVAATSDGSMFLIAQGLVGAIVGAPKDSLGARGAGSISPLWTPPEQADGAMWDNAANRYAIGLILYRLLSGEHAFGGGGLRHALGEAAHREAAPFVESVASMLPSGLQSLALRLLDPQKDRRPAKAELIEADLDRFYSAREEGITKVSPGNSAVVAPAREAPVKEAERRSQPAEAAAKRPASKSRAPEAEGEEDRDRSLPKPATLPARRASRGKSDGKLITDKLSALWPIAAGVAVAGFALSRLGPEPPAPKLASVAPEQPLSAQQTSAQDCADCHTRQAAEWRRSVMAHSVKSPLFNALEAVIEEQAGRDFDCPNGAGILRKANLSTACRDRASGLPVTGSGGEHWCVNCHSPADNLESAMPAWDGRPGGDPRSRRPVRDLINDRAIEGISCGFCHQVHGPVGPRSARGYQGNPSWTSFVTGAVFPSRPEDGRGLFGIANSGYDLRPEELILPSRGRSSGLVGSADPAGDAIVHAYPSASAKAYLRSSEFCGACHDVRLFGTDSLGAGRGEHFKRLRNAYSEWAVWAKDEERRGRTPASCQDCHMSTYPGVCEPNPSGVGAEEVDPECPPGTRFSARAPGSWPSARVASSSRAPTDVVTHYFSGVDVPLAKEFAEALVDEASVDVNGVPTGARKRRDLLLRHTFRFEIGAATQRGSQLSIPIEIENVGAGHRVPAGFSQEREFWVHLVVRDGAGRTLYEVGRVTSNGQDLLDKRFERINANPSSLDRLGRPEGFFGADITDGPDVPIWDPPPILGGTSFRGRGLINFQNGFLRCVRCIGEISPRGECLPGRGQGFTRADRFEDGDYDIDTGECRSNLSGINALFETYLPLGALDASRGLFKGPDAIIDTRSAPPNVPIRYTYELTTEGRRGPFRAEARLLFRSFPPYLVRAFAEYEREQAQRGLRPSGPLVTNDMVRRLEIVELARVEAEVR